MEISVNLLRKMVILLIKDNYELLNIDILGEGRRRCLIDKLCIICVYINIII